jgi:hypothetical protein
VTESQKTPLCPSGRLSRRSVALTLKVLVWAPAGADGALINESPWPTTSPWRVLRYVEPLAAMGIELRGLPLEVGAPAEYAAGREAVKAAAEWADVILWRPYETDWSCRGCADAIPNEALARKHAAATGHEPFPDNMLLRAFLNTLGPRRAQVGMLCDTDFWVEADTLWWVPAWLRDQVTGWRYPTETADLITASTPRLARHCERFNPRVRVIRNSVDVSEYVPDGPRRKGRARLVWYSAGSRVGDWMGPAQAAARDHRDHLRSVFVGAGMAHPEEEAGLRAAGFDEVRPAVNFRVWPRALANAWPDIGISPLTPSPYNACRSEQHFLEFAALGCPTVVQRWRGAGPFPYDVVRDGVDGLLARGRQEWGDAIGRLARSPQLRADIGGAARERVVAEYDVRDRAQELADALRWAAEHAGIGLAEA